MAFGRPLPAYDSPPVPSRPYPLPRIKVKHEIRFPVPIKFFFFLLKSYSEIGKPCRLLIEPDLIRPVLTD